MVQQTSLEPHQIKDYQDSLKFFKASLGILEPLRDEIPHSEIYEELTYAKNLGFKEIGKGIIAKHALLSFFPSQLRDNPLIILYVYKKLFEGVSSLSKRSKSALHKYFGDDDKEKEEEKRKNLQGEKFKLEECILKSSKIAIAMLRALDKMLPSYSIDFYFDNYLKQLIFWKDSLLKDDYQMIDKIFDNFWYSQNWNYSTEEYFMLLTLADLFDKTEKPFSLQFFHEHVESIKDLLLEKFDNCSWIIDEKERTTNWNKFINQGVNFSYKINTKSLGLYPVSYTIQLHPKTDSHFLKYSLDFLKNNYFTFENRSQNSLVLHGSMYIPYEEIDDLSSFFIRLKDLRVIVDFLLVSGKQNSLSISNPNSLKRSQHDIKVKLSWENPVKKTPFKMDAFDSLLLLNLRRIGFMGFPMDDISNFSGKIKAQVKGGIADLEERLGRIDKVIKYKQIQTEFLEQLIPTCFYSGEITTIQDYLDNTFLSSIENLYFLEKWNHILSSLESFLSSEKKKDFESKLDIQNFDTIREKNPTLFIEIRNQMQSLKKFVIGAYNNLKNPKKNKKAYSTKNLLNRFIQMDDEKNSLADLVQNLDSLIFLLKIELDLSENNRKSLVKALSSLQGVYKLDDSKLLMHFKKKLELYLKKEIIAPNLLYSVVLEDDGYYSCWYLPTQVPITARDNIVKQFRNMNFSQEKNLLGKWDLNYGANKPSEIENFWKISHKLRIPTISFIKTQSSPFYHYDDLYNFAKNEFSSLKPLMKKVLDFYSKCLRNEQKQKETGFFKYFDRKQTISGMKKAINQKLLNKNLKIVPPKLFSKPNLNHPEISEIFADARDRDTSIFLSPNNTCMKGIKLEVNWPRIGLEEYIISVKIKKEVFSHKAIPHPVNTREFLCVPGIKEIYSSTNTGYFQSTFIHFIFPFNSPPYNIFHSSERWNYIEDLVFIRVKSKKIWFNSQFLVSNTQGFNPWILIGHRITTNKGEMPGEFPIVIEYSPDQNIVGPNSPQFRTIQKVYGKNLQRLKNIPIFNNVQKLFINNIVWYLPNFEQIYPLPLRAIIQLYPLNSMQFKILNSLFTAVPLSIQYTVEYEIKNHRYEGLYVDVRFHSCNLSEILCEIEKIVRYLKVKNYRVVPSVVNITKEEFIGYKHLKNYPNLFNSFIWKDNRFNNIKFLDRYGPLDYNERYKQLK